MKPKIALRPDEENGPHNAEGVPLDDVVVTGVTMFRAEFMDTNELWLCCYLTTGERISFYASTKRAPMTLIATEVPTLFDDFDAEVANA